MTGAMLTDAQRELLEDKAAVWERAAASGTVEWQDYNRRAAEALRAALAAPPASSKGEALPVAVTDEMVEAAKANIASSRLRIPLHLHRDIDALVRHVTDLEVRCGAMKAVATAEKERWLKAASKHVRADGRKSDCRERDLERARIAHRIEEGTAALSLPRPASDKGEEAPVAWRWRLHPQTPWHLVSEDPRDDELYVEPLYARPSPGVSREEVARIIDPNAYAGVYDQAVVTGFVADRRASAEGRADLVIALLSRGEG